MKKKTVFYASVTIMILMQAVEYQAQGFVFTKEPLDRILVTGSHNITISCEASTLKKEGTISILWKHNSSWITDFKNKHYKQLENGSLFLIQFLERDVGSYQCAAVRSLQNKRVEQVLSRVAKVQAASLGSQFKYITPNTKAILGSTVHLKCVTPDSLPTAIVSWLKNGLKLSGYRNESLPMGFALSSTLELSNITFESVGSYECLAFNSIQQTQVKSQVISLSIEAERPAPYFYQQPIPLTTTRHSTARFDCIVMGIPKPNLTWQKGNQVLSDSSKYTILKNGSILIFKVENVDNGLYYCTGRNSISSIQSVPVSLTVAYINYDFIENPQSLNSVSGSTFLLNCRPPTSYPNETKIKWFFEYNEIIKSQRIRLLSNNSLLVQKSMITDDGEYFCHATNSFTNEGRTSQKARIRIYVAPEAFAESVRVVLGRETILNCNSSGIPSPSVIVRRYFHHNQTFAASTSSPVIITSSKTSDGGLYVCTATNEAGSKTVNITLTVLVPPFVKEFPQSQTAVQEQTLNVNFSCKIGGNPQPTIDWYFVAPTTTTTPLKQHMKMLNVGAYTTNRIGESILTISNPSKEHEGRYTCAGENKVGKVNSTAFLKIYEPPNIAVALNSTVSVREGSNKTLSCAFTGDPRPQIVWRYDGTIIGDGGHLVDEVETAHKVNRTWLVRSDLLLSNISFECHNGVYSCSARNSYGVANQTTQFKVKVFPTITDFMTNGTLQLAHEINITCRAHASPVLEMNIYHNGSLVTKRKATGKYHGSLILNVKRMTSRDSGVYKCVARNDVGETQRTLSVSVKVRPGRPWINSSSTSKSRSITIYWLQPFDGYSSLQRYVLEMKKSNMSAPTSPSSSLWTVVAAQINSTAESFLVAKLQPYTEYVFRLKAVNKVGGSNYSALHYAQTTSEAPSQVYDVVVSNKTSRAISLTWRPPIETNGELASFQVQYEENRIVDIPVTQESPRYNHAVLDLIPYAVYAIKVRAGTRGQKTVILWGNFSQDLEVKTLGEVPGDTVHSVQLSNVTASSFYVGYLPPNANKIYGEFQGYELRLVSINNLEVHSYGTNQTWFTFDNLTPYTAYELQIAVRNSMGIGKYKDALRIRTQTPVPGLVANITVTEVNITTIKISWHEPRTKNGPIEGYKVVVSSVDLLHTYWVSSQVLFSQNFTGNTSYVAYVTAKTSAGFGGTGHGIAFKTTEQFLGLGKIQPVTTQLPPAPRTWLDREYLVVIVAVSAFSFFLVISLCVVAIIRCHFSKKFRKGHSFELDNPYYETADGDEVIGNKFAKKRRPSFPTLAMRNLKQDEDFIWDDDAIDDLIDSSSIEPEYAYTNPATAQINPPSPPPLPPPMRQRNDEGGEIIGATYSCVDPYQGRNMDLSPLVKLRGMNKNKRHPNIPAAFSPSKTPLQNIDRQTSPASGINNNLVNNRRRSSHSTSSGNRSSPSSIRRTSPSNLSSNSRASLSRLDVNDMSKQQRRKRHKKGANTRQSHYTDVTVLPHGDLGTRGYGAQF